MSYTAIARLLKIPSHQTVRYWISPKVRQQKAEYHQKNQAKILAYKTTYYTNNHSDVRARQTKYRLKNLGKIKEQKKEHYQENREDILQRNAQWRRDNSDIVAQTALRYRKENPHKVRAWGAQRRADKRNATPPWFTPEHKRRCDALHAEAVRLERETGIQHHVDHIYPITGKTRLNGRYQHTSCGLHVPWNLKVLPGPENCSKSCKMPDPAVDPPTAW